jgi:release factor glutamine methyltransferase
VDVVCGSGAGGVIARRLLGPTTRVVLADSNREALTLAAINAVLNDIPSPETVMSDVLSGGGRTRQTFDDGTRLHAHGGGEFGISLALRIAQEALARLAPGGRLVLYAGAPIVPAAILCSNLCVLCSSATRVS